MKNFKNLLWIGALLALAGCDPFEETKGGTPEILSVMASGGDHDFGASVVAEAAAPAAVGAPWVIEGTSTCEIPAAGEPNAGQQLIAADQYVIFVKTNKLLDGFTIEQVANSCVPFGVTEATPDTPWFTVTSTSGSTPIGTSAADEMSHWYSCYFPGTATASEGASIVFYRAGGARVWNTAPTADVIPGDLGSTGASWFDVGATLPTRTDDRTRFVITGTAFDKGGVEVPINVELTVHPDAGAADLAPTAITGTVAAGAVNDATLTIDWAVGPCTSANATYTLQQLTGTDPALDASWENVAGAVDVNADGSVPVTVDLVDDSALNYGEAYTYRLVEKIVGAETLETFTKVAAEFTQAILLTPTPPTTTVNGTAVTVQFAPVFGATSYRVERAIDVEGAEFVVAGTVAATAANDQPYSLTNSGLDPATTYLFRIVAENANGESLPGTPTPAITP